MYLLLLVRTDMPREIDPYSAPLGLAYTSMKCRVDPGKPRLCSLVSERRLADMHTYTQETGLYTSLSQAASA